MKLKLHKHTPFLIKSSYIKSNAFSVFLAFKETQKPVKYKHACRDLYIIKIYTLTDNFGFKPLFTRIPFTLTIRPSIQIFHCFKNFYKPFGQIF